MPYVKTSELPENIKQYSPVVKRQWMHVWNSTFTKTNSEARAFKAANSILKKRFKKQDSLSNDTRADYFNHLVDGWLGNLPG